MVTVLSDRRAGIIRQRVVYEFKGILKILYNITVSTWTASCMEVGRDTILV